MPTDLQSLGPIILAVSLALCCLPLIIGIFIIGLLWFRFSGNNPVLPQQIQRILPLLETLPTILKKTSKALTAISKTLSLIEGNISSAGSLLEATASLSPNFAINVPSFKTEEFKIAGKGTNLYYIKDLDPSHKENLNVLREKIQSAGSDLKANAELMRSLKMDIEIAATALENIVSAFDPQP